MNPMDGDHSIFTKDVDGIVEAFLGNFSDEIFVAVGEIF